MNPPLSLLRFYPLGVFEARKRKEDKHLVLFSPPLPFLHGCVVEERGKERLFVVVSLAGVSTLLLPSLRFGIILCRVWWGVFSGAGRSFSPGSMAGLWKLHPAAGC